MTLEAVRLLAIILSVVAAVVGAAAYRAVVALRRVPPNVYAEMENTLADMTRTQNEMRAQQAADHLAMRQMEIQITRLEITVLKLSEQVRQLGGVPVAELEPMPTPPPVVDDRTLAAAIAALFNVEELDNLALDMGARPDDLTGSTIGRRASSLVLWAARRNRTARLIARAAELRPDGGLE